ncbi:MAG: redox-sensing transcriptional repressor Rex, partial [Desulfobacterales bacterium]|nr:redox-sensing transcriptional repressor Rex [Desulfobacterales bacterium]
NPAQVRNDLGYFGDFGVRGMGYDVIDLQAQIKKILAVNRYWNLSIAGIGTLGSALMKPQNILASNFKCVAIFDNDPNKIGKVTPTGLKIRDTHEIHHTARELKIEIGVITTPPSAAQNLADLFLDAQVNAILNFSPTRIRVPDYCFVENIDFTLKLDMLTFKLHHEQTPQGINAS